MSKLVIKTGMANEAAIAKTHAAPGTLILSGVQSVTALEHNVPSDARAILSFGMCGGLRPGLPVVGQTVIANRLIGPTNELYHPDSDWVQRLSQATHAAVQPYFSNGLYNTANDPKQRAQIWARSQAWCIDDESLAVAQFADKHNLSWAILRNVSDAWDDDVTVTNNLLNTTGGVNVWNVIKAFITHPINMLNIWRHYNISNQNLNITATKAGPTFQWRE